MSSKLVETLVHLTNINICFIHLPNISAAPNMNQEQAEGIVSSKTHSHRASTLASLPGVLRNSSNFSLILKNTCVNNKVQDKNVNRLCKEKE